MKISCIIVDDEPASREILEKYISDCTSLKLISSCRNAFDANEIINHEQIQLIFLDINMPKLSGIKFYKSLSNPPFVIFTTAYPEFAVEGFEVDAIDYLLKPFSFERFLKSVNKALTIFNQIDNKNHVPFIVLKSDKKLFRVNISDINYLEALGDYVKVDFLCQSIMVHDTFQNLLILLGESNLIRVHKSFAISLNKFDHIEGNMIKIKDKAIPIGQKYRADLLKIINSCA
ncbi:MAG: response regulator transcription factor [Bacteroidales bacterium]